MAPLRVLIADDNATTRAATAHLISRQGDMQVVGQAVDGEDAVAQAQQLCPDVVLMDIGMPRLNGIEATRQIVAQCPGVKVICLSLYGPQAMADLMLKAGAVAYVSKSDADDKLLATIRAAV